MKAACVTHYLLPNVSFIRRQRSDTLRSSLASGSADSEAPVFSAGLQLAASSFNFSSSRRSTAGLGGTPSDRLEDLLATRPRLDLSSAIVSWWDWECWPSSGRLDLPRPDLSAPEEARAGVIANPRPESSAPSASNTYGTPAVAPLSTLDSIELWCALESCCDPPPPDRADSCFGVDRRLLSCCCDSSRRIATSRFCKATCFTAWCPNKTSPSEAP